jgi:hypothetical protein
VVDAHRVVRGDRAVDEAAALVAAVLLAQPLERALTLPALEHVAFDGRKVGYVGSGSKIWPIERSYRGLDGQ